MYSFESVSSKVCPVGAIVEIWLFADVTDVSGLESEVPTVFCFEDGVFMKLDPSPFSLEEVAVVIPLSMLFVTDIKDSDDSITGID